MKGPGLEALLLNCIEHLKNTGTGSSQTIKKKKWNLNSPQLILEGQPNPDTKKQRHEKKNLNPIPIMNIDTKLLKSTKQAKSLKHIKNIP